MPIARAEMQEMAKGYDCDAVGIAVLGSHSALELGMSATSLGMPCTVVVEKGRSGLYTKHNRHLFTDVIELDKFSEILNESVQEELRQKNRIFIPNRSFSVYACKSKETRYDDIENNFKVPMYGNRFILRAEDRKDEKGQYHILKSAGIRIPKQFKTPEEIDRLAIVKVQQAGNELERAFFYVKNAEDYDQQAKKLKDQGVISEKTLKEARIEEYVLGARYNANFHKYALTEFFGDFDFVGTSDRRQVNLQGFLNLPAREQLKLDVPVKNEEIGHFGLTIRESKQPDLYKAAEKLFHSEQLLKDYPPGIIGLCGIQGAMAYSPTNPKELEFVVFDLSPRIPGDPAMGPTTPEMKNLTLKHRKEIKEMFGSDAAITDPLDLSIMEIRAAAMDKRLGAIVT